MSHYLRFIQQNALFLLFGFLLSMFSSFGQTFFISLFSADIRQQFQLSHGEFGGIYSLATLMSALCLTWVGRKIDTTDLRRYITFICVGMTCACLLFAQAQNIIMLLLGIWLLRLTGQGLMTHTSATSMARYYTENRGKAISIAGMGLSFGEALFPTIAVALLSLLGWRLAWELFAVVVAFGLLPVLLFLLNRQPQQAFQASSAVPERKMTTQAQRQWSLKEVLHDPRFYLILPAVMAPAFIITGVFFHQVHMVEAKGWTLQMFASAFICFSASTIAANLIIGVMVDKVGVFRLLPFFLIPFALGLMALGSSNHPGVAFAFMAGAGISMGVASLLSITLWSEVYGTRYLGAIRAATSSLMVFFTAIAPVLIGGLLDHKVHINLIIYGLAAYVILAALLAVIANQAYARGQSEQLNS